MSEREKIKELRDTCEMVLADISGFLDEQWDGAEGWEALKRRLEKTLQDTR